VSCDGLAMAGEVLWRRWLQSFAFLQTTMELTKRLRFVNLPQFATLHDSTMADPDALIGQPSPTTASSGLESASRRMELYAAKYPGKYFVFDCSEHTIADSIDTSPTASATIEDVKGGRGVSAVA